MIRTEQRNGYTDLVAWTQDEIDDRLNAEYAMQCYWEMLAYQKRMASGDYIDRTKDPKRGTTYRRVLHDSGYYFHEEQ